ncbi:mono/diheme cytochrome c family protein [Silvibacterium bohemicum]|uniref:Mono/diheme cytochrome c family protein n=1 Tax=Silvibacterium bohemicum TaxID=1577686 RepID=A0A841JME0_9BACT|nr:cytochrome c [Silvibacterium bohemicum]MBB6142290.1 mono/diheme cytochrome c family protein [Silvibacterium bohemicum]
MKAFLLGLILGLCILPLAVFTYFHAGHPPVAVADKSFVMEKELVSVPLHARIDKEMPKSPPIEANATNLETGAHIYRQQCAACHGLYGRPSSFASHMYPNAPQLWAPHEDGVVGVSDDPPGETYWKVSNGIRLTGMPAYDKVLNPTQMWQVSLLLANADKPLPPGVLDLLKQPLDLDPATLTPASAATGPAQKITDIQMNSMPPAIPAEQK